MKSTLIALALALATLVLLEPTANALVHRMPLSHLRLPETSTGTEGSRFDAAKSPLARLAKHHGHTTESLKQRLLQERTAPAASSSDSCSGNGNGGSSSGSGSGGMHSSLTSEYGFMMVAEASIGTEGQGPFIVDVDFWADQLYVIDAKAKYTNGGRMHNKQTFNSTASSTFTQSNGAFIDADPYMSGAVGEDVAVIGALNANISLQVAKKVEGWMRDFDIDGTLGLGVSDEQDGSSLVESLAPQLNSPVVTYHMNQPWYNWWNSEDAPEGSGVLSFGDLAADTCDVASWAPITSDWASWLTGMPVFDITSVSRATSDACDATITANITVLPMPYFMPYVVSYQLEQLLVKASGAKWDSDIWMYTVADVSKAQPVTMQLANGGSIQLTPEDYLLEADGYQLLFTIGFYNQDMYADDDFIALPQQFINNHCFSMNATSGAWSIGNALKMAESVYVPGSSSSSVEYD